jgi:hypothetical protein
MQPLPALVVLVILRSCIFPGMKSANQPHPQRPAGDTVLVSRT